MKIQCIWRRRRKKGWKYKTYEEEGQKTKSKRSEFVSTSKRARIVDSDDDFEDFPAQFQKIDKIIVDAVVAKRNRLSKNVILLESKYLIYIYLSFTVVLDVMC